MKSRFFNKVDKFNGTFTQLEENSRRWESFIASDGPMTKLSEQLMESTVQAHVLGMFMSSKELLLGEHQATDYPSCGPNIPGYEPRGCPRGASFSWYEYSPVRIKYPYIRGKL